MSFCKHNIFFNQKQPFFLKLLCEWNFKNVCARTMGTQREQDYHNADSEQWIKEVKFSIFSIFSPFIFGRKFMQFGNCSMIPAHL